MEKKGMLILEDGKIFEGKLAGAYTTKIGELCFNTGMTGYMELFTDPSYYSQILIMTNIHVGNYGIYNLENQSQGPKIFGLICKEISNFSSRKVDQTDINSYFETNNLPILYGIDTRELVKYIRDKGNMNAAICNYNEDVDLILKDIQKSNKMEGTDLATIVSTKESYCLGQENDELRIAVYDYGVKQGILDIFLKKGCYLKIFNANTSFEEILKWKPTGLFLSNGPGDPMVMNYAITNIKKALEINIPIFGICLGNQLLAIANGAKTYKMHNGHRGMNQPVINLIKNTSEITSQNHSFVIDIESLKECNNVQITHKNLNDNSIEGICIKDKKAFSVQFHPENCPGPHDSRYLFDEFIKMIKCHN